MTPARTVALPWLWPWPLPAVMAWVAGWATAWLCRQAGVGAGWELVAGMAAGAALASMNTGRRRRLIAALGFPLSALLLASLEGRLGAGVWLAALLPLALFYPLRTWRDAPFFPTPACALRGLEAVVLPAPQRLLDAGCGLGHGLAALQRLWPEAALHGVEWSAPMAWLAAWRVPRAKVRRGDMWHASWAGFDMVYLFQRPESMARAWAKARAELPTGAWLASLEFAVPGVRPHATLRTGAGRPVFVYHIGTTPGLTGSTGSTAATAGR